LKIAGLWYSLKVMAHVQDEDNAAALLETVSMSLAGQSE